MHLEFCICAEMSATKFNYMICFYTSLTILMDSTVDALNSNACILRTHKRSSLLPSLSRHFLSLPHTLELVSMFILLS